MTTPHVRYVCTGCGRITVRYASVLPAEISVTCEGCSADHVLAVRVWDAPDGRVQGAEHGSARGSSERIVS